jgi:hypothetical protein
MAQRQRVHHRAINLPQVWYTTSYRGKSEQQVTQQVSEDRVELML